MKKSAQILEFPKKKRSTKISELIVGMRMQCPCVDCVRFRATNPDSKIATLPNSGGSV